MRITRRGEFWAYLVIGTLGLAVLAAATVVLPYWWQVGLIAIGDVPMVVSSGVMVLVSVDWDRDVW